MGNKNAKRNKLSFHYPLLEEAMVWAGVVFQNICFRCVVVCPYSVFSTGFVHFAFYRLCHCFSTLLLRNGPCATRLPLTLGVCDPHFVEEIINPFYKSILKCVYIIFYMNNSCFQIGKYLRCEISN